MWILEKVKNWKFSYKQLATWLLLGVLLFGVAGGYFLNDLVNSDGFQSVFKGEQGDTGPKGATGPRGNTGLTGPIGGRGLKGNTGAIGATGSTGATGSSIVGPRGGLGPRGVTGARGPRGATGPRGARGARGPRGATGPAGSPGTPAPPLEAVTLPCPAGFTRTAFQVLSSSGVPVTIFACRTGGP